MIDTNAFVAQFAGHQVPPFLLRLLEYQNVVGYGRYSQALTLSVGERSGLIHGWSADPEFLSRLLPFAMANASGSFYALWNNGSSAVVDQWPVVAFGDEGGEWVVAQNVSELLSLSTFDEEPMIDYHGVAFFKDPEWYQESEFLDDYKQWLKAQLNLEAIEDPAPLVAAAQAALQEAFNVWKQPFLKHKDGPA
ncbi:hypothetical protein AACH06_29690 [Ideonella sp. DXS29W]|uniref:SMI1/KNR4 family protein n=1 Tax=Ideonella lacteola TaxID=2984193 RepID=A0ABU9C0W7_9BURK